MKPKSLTLLTGLLSLLACGKGSDRKEFEKVDLPASSAEAEEQQPLDDTPFVITIKNTIDSTTARNGAIRTMVRWTITPESITVPVGATVRFSYRTAGGGCTVSFAENHDRGRGFLTSDQAKQFIKTVRPQRMIFDQLATMGPALKLLSKDAIDQLKEDPSYIYNSLHFIPPADIREFQVSLRNLPKRKYYFSCSGTPRELQDTLTTGGYNGNVGYNSAEGIIVLTNESTVVDPLHDARNPQQRN